MNQKENELTYSKEELEKIRQTDPTLEGMTRRWERSFGSRIQVSKDGDNLVVRKKHENQSLGQ